jgi:hypothetical protein
MKAQSREDRVAALEEYVFQRVIAVMRNQVEEQLFSERAAASGHDMQDFEIRLLLLAALKHRALKDTVNITTRELVALLVEDLDESASR